MNNIKLLLPAYAKKQLSESGGRQVVDKMFDVSLNRRIIEWSGTDRPEYTDFGGAKVCVEAERTNSMPDSRDMTTWGSAGAGGVTVSRDAAGYDGEPNTACTITGGGDQNDRAFTNVSVPDDSNTHCGSVFVKKGTGVIRFYTYVFGGTQVATSSTLNTATGEVSGPGVVEDWGLWWRVWQTVTNNSSGNTTYQMRLYPSQDAPYTGSAIFDQAQVELNASYPTLPIITSGSPVTRLAPTVPIQDALPETGTVAGVCDAILLDDDSVTNQYIFTNGGVFGSKTAFRFYFRPDLTNSLIFEINGSGGQITAKYPFPETDRAVFAWAITYVEGTYTALILDSQGNVHSYSRALSDPISTSLDHSSDVYLGGDASGNQTSMRFEKPWHRDEIDRTGATADEIKAFFEFLTLGTSMQMTADEMEIVS